MAVATSWRVPRLLPQSRKKKALTSRPELVAFYNAYREHWEQHPLCRGIAPHLITRDAPRFQAVLTACRMWEVEPLAYLAWIFNESGFSYPEHLLGWMASPAIQRQFQAHTHGVRMPARVPHLLGYQDVETAEPVRWFYDGRGRLLLTPPPDGRVRDETGRERRLVAVYDP